MIFNRAILHPSESPTDPVCAWAVFLICFPKKATLSIVIFLSLGISSSFLHKIKGSAYCYLLVVNPTILIAQPSSVMYALHLFFRWNDATLHPNCVRWHTEILVHYHTSILQFIWWFWKNTGTWLASMNALLDSNSFQFNYRTCGYAQTTYHCHFWYF